MEQKFSKNSIDLQALREFCEREGEVVVYRKGDQMEREGDPARWFAFVTEGCFKYVTHGISDDKEHITWFSFAGEYVCDYSVSSMNATSTSIVPLLASATNYCYNVVLALCNTCHSMLFHLSFPSLHRCFPKSAKTLLSTLSHSIYC